MKDLGAYLELLRSKVTTKGRETFSLLTKKEENFLKLMDTRYVTVNGKATIPDLIRMYGNPVIIKKYAKVEVRTGGTKKPTIIVERFIDAVLKFTDQIVVPDIAEGILLDIPSSGVVIEWIRHPNYNPEKMPKATKAEIRKSEIEK